MQLLRYYKVVSTQEARKTPPAGAKHGINKVQIILIIRLYY